MDDLVVTRMNIFQLQVCTTIEGRDAIERRANEVNPAGTTHGWRLSDDPKYAPVVCNDNPDRNHYILEC